jgi:hypothetical protein
MVTHPPFLSLLASAAHVSMCQIDNNTALNHFLLEALVWTLSTITALWSNLQRDPTRAESMLAACRKGWSVYQPLLFEVVGTSSLSSFPLRVLTLTLT